MKLLISFIGLFTLICIQPARAQEHKSNPDAVVDTHVSPNGAATLPIEPWGQREGLSNPYGPMDDAPGSVWSNPMYSSPAGNPSGSQAPVAKSNSGEKEGSRLNAGQPATGKKPSALQPASRVPSAPADGGTVSGATTGSSSTMDAEAIAPDGRKRK